MDQLTELIQCRHEILSVIEENWRQKPEIVAQTQNARTTVDRGIDELRQHDLVERSGSSYRATPVGRHLLERYNTYAADVNEIGEAKDLL